jgi:hypothetical protein
MNKTQDQSLDRILESAVVLSWADLVFNAQSSLIQIEYGFAPSGTLDYLKVWYSNRAGALASCLFVLDVYLPSFTRPVSTSIIAITRTVWHIFLISQCNIRIFSCFRRILAGKDYFRFQFLHQRRAEAAEESVSLAFAHVESRLAQPALDRMAS